ncbi:MAG: NAD-dependent epimerase/dehydratase family protein [Nitratireductor sp.]
MTSVTGHTGKIAVFGANGRLGREIAGAFHQAGWQVRAVARHSGSRSPDAGLPPAIERFEADLHDREKAIAAAQGCDFIFNALNPLYPDWSRDVMPLSRNVAAAAAACGAVHLFPGNVYNFGTTIPVHPTEETRQSGDHRKAAIRIEAEEFFRAEAQAGRAKTLVLRAGDFFGGTGTGSWFDLILTAKLAKGKFTYPGPMDKVHAWAYLPDLARAFVQLAENAGQCADFEHFHFGGHNVTGAELQAALERVTAQNLRTASFPWLMVKALGLFSPMMREVGEMAYLWRAPHRLTGEKLAAIAGPAISTPLEVAAREALTALGRMPQARRGASVAMPSLAA